ncbi:MAG: hypothetical protein HFJ50_05280 [Clostridia bacterium]|nr:hypothetical protein [Clostridia bacterium]
MDFDYGLTFCGGTRFIKWKESERTDMGLKNPGILYFPFVERFGLLLLRFLNADLSTYESAYKDFFYAYGFEILRDVNEDYSFELNRRIKAIYTFSKVCSLSY